MKKIKTPLDLQLAAINVSCNRAKSDWSFGKARTFGKMLRAMGYKDGDIDYIYSPEEQLRYVTVADIERYRNGLKNQAQLNYKTYEQKEEIRSIDEDYAKLLGITIPTSSDSIPRTNICTSTQTVILDEGEEGSVGADIASEISEHYNPKPDNQDAILTKKQAEAAREIVDGMYEGTRGFLLLAGTGTGKTYVAGSIIRNIMNNDFLKGRTISPWPILYVTRSSVVFQAEEVFEDEFGLSLAKDVHVINIEQLRSFLGKIFIDVKVLVEDGKEKEDYVWRPIVHPCIVIWDECQGLKNIDSIQSRIAQRLCEVEEKTGSPVFQISMSATPFTRVCEGKHFALSTKIHHNFGVAQDIPLIERHWAEFSRSVAYPSDPEEYCTAAIDRFTSRMDPYIVRMKNVRSKFKAFNSVSKIDFKTQEERDFYDRAWTRHQAKKARIEGAADILSKSQSRFMMLAIFTQYRKAAEVCKVQYFAEFAHKTWENGEAPVIATCFKGAITGVVKELITKYNWSRDDISIIWGGSVETLSNKKKMAKKLHSNVDVMAAFKIAGIDLAELGLDYDEEELIEKTDNDLAFEKEYRLLTQDRFERRKEIKRFMKQKSKLCLFTFKSGGVGLSLHHQFPQARPRIVVLTPTYSAMELVQGLGRCPRLTSLSHTYQSVVFYRNTIEEEVANRVSLKLKCLSKVVRQRESWEDIIVGSKYARKQMMLDVVDETINDELAGTYMLEEDNESSNSSG